MLYKTKKVAYMSFTQENYYNIDGRRIYGEPLYFYYKENLVICIETIILWKTPKNTNNLHDFYYYIRLGTTN